MTLASLENASYREKLTIFMDEANSMRYTEREAAALYGDMMSSLIMLQRRIHEWASARRAITNHEKVTARTRSDYISMQKPDQTAIELRETQRWTHGWRAPLNKPYWQLGSSSSDPLSRTQKVHTSLGKYPPKGEEKK